MSFSILVVEDDPFEQKNLETILRSEDFSLEFADRGQAGILKAVDRHPDLVILDIILPDIDGFEVCRQIRAHADLAEVAIVMVTVLGDHASRLKGIEAGADDFLSKPYDPLEMSARVRTIARLNRYSQLHEERHRFENLVDLTPDGIVLINQAGIIQFANESAREDYKILPGKKLLSNLGEVTIGGSHINNDQAWIPDELNLQDNAIQEIVFQKEEGYSNTIEIRARALKWQGELAYLICLHDITTHKDLELNFRQLNLALENRVDERTREMQEAVLSLINEIAERHKVEMALRDINFRLRRITDNMLDMIVQLDPLGYFKYASPSHRPILGYDPDSLIGKCFYSFIGADDLLAVQKSTQQVFSSGVPERIEYRFRHSDGHFLWIESNISVISDEGDGAPVCGVVLGSRDITERKTAEISLEYLGQHDGLTGLYNRSFYENELDRLCAGKKYPLSLLMIDIDGLKRVNDQQGHSQGDLLLIRAADLLKKSFRTEDRIARFGGDEFVVLLPNTDKAATRKAITRLMNGLKRINSAHPELAFSFSVGGATATKFEEVKDLLDRADQSMYRMKGSER